MKEDAVKSSLVEVLLSSPKEEAGGSLAVWFQDPAVNIQSTDSWGTKEGETVPVFCNAAFSKWMPQWLPAFYFILTAEHWQNPWSHVKFKKKNKAQVSSRQLQAQAGWDPCSWLTFITHASDSLISAVKENTVT